MKSVFIAIGLTAYIAHAESLKATVHFPNNEEKTFRFSTGNKNPKLDLGEDALSLCMITGGPKQYSFGCWPKPKANEPLIDAFSLPKEGDPDFYTVEIECDKSPIKFTVSNGLKTYSLKFQCEK